MKVGIPSDLPDANRVNDEIGPRRRHRPRSVILRDAAEQGPVGLCDRRVNTTEFINTARKSEQFFGRSFQWGLRRGTTCYCAERVAFLTGGCVPGWTLGAAVCAR